MVKVEKEKYSCPEKVTSQVEQVRRHPLMVGIIGSIGVGKTTLADYLAEEWNTVPIKENFIDNPFLKEFYKDKSGAFKSEVCFGERKTFQLSEEQLSKVVTNGHIVVDMALEMDGIFANTQFKMGQMNSAEFGVYQELMKALKEERHVRNPDLCIVLTAPLETIIERGKKRGRDIEKEISPDYLQKLGESITEWVKEERKKGTPILEIDYQHYEVVSSAKDRRKVVGWIDASIKEMINNGFKRDNYLRLSPDTY